MITRYKENVDFHSVLFTDSKNKLNMCTVVRRRAPEVFAALLNDSNSPAGHFINSTHSPRYNEESIYLALMASCGPSYTLFVLATSSSFRSVAIVLVLD